jgi:cyclopropane fatty-acyl-phospholipid synthase-like methyltransferase
MAIALMEGFNGTYHGIDVSKEMVDWCQQNITPLNPSFTFEHIDIANDAYNKTGKLRNDDFTIGKSNHYDFIFLTSVFTHMLEDGLFHYLEEIEKALKPCGTVFATFFLLNEESKKLIADKKADWHFIYQMEHGAYFVAGSPESALAYDEDFIRQVFNDNKLSIPNIFYGSWCHRENYLSYQDIIVAKKC